MSNKFNKRFDKRFSFDDFKELAKDVTLNSVEKIGFPIEYRDGYEDFIFNDIKQKLPILNEIKKNIVDIGCGCSNLTKMLIEHCKQHSHKLFLVDSEEMLDNIKDNYVIKIVGKFPDECSGFIEQEKYNINGIISYSVIHHIFANSNVFDFVDASLLLLSDGGSMLIGDIPNISMRKRFFSSLQGIEFHKNFMETDLPPVVKFNEIDVGSIDDSIILSMLMRTRLGGFDSYVLPQSKELPMANRREDIFIKKP